MTVRASALDASELCGHVKTLAEKYPAGSRYTLLGIARHPLATPEDLAKLTAEEREELATFAPFPADKIVPADAADFGYEMQVGLTPEFKHCEYDAEGRLTQGTADVAWRVGRIAFVVDVKPDTERYSPMRLQNAAYAFALADKWMCTHIRLGIWGYRDAKLRWNEGGPLERGDDRWNELKTRVFFAATRDREAITGPHCADCYQRLHCEHRLLPAALGEASPALAVVSQGGAELWSPERAFRLHDALKALKDLEARGDEGLKAYIESQGGSVRYNDRELALTQVSGREYVPVALVKAEGLSRLVRRTKPSTRLVNRKATR